MGRKSITKNYIFNLIYQIFVLLTPLITTPYIARVLGSAGVGQYSFSASITYYFTLFAALGFGYYAQREIAKLQSDKREQSKVFWEIIIVRLLSVSIALVAYFAFIFFGPFGEGETFSEYAVLLKILAIDIFSVIFDITFLFQGNEDFGNVVFRNIIFKILGIAFIFIFVKTENDLWLYVLGNHAFAFLSNLVLWTRLPKVLEKVTFRELKIMRHFLPALRLFIPTIAISIYTVLDKTLIGLLIPGITADGRNISDVENGYYEQAQKLVKMAMALVTSLSVVMLPRNSKEIADGNLEGFKKNIYDAMTFVFFLGVPIMFGLMAVAQNLTPWFFGEGYEKVPYLIMLFSPIVVIIGFSNVLGLHYLLPQGRDKNYTIAVCSGAGINLLLNILFIPKLFSYGAAIASLIAELAVDVIMLFFARKDVSLWKILKNIWKYLLAGGIMFGVVYATQYFLSASILNTFLLIVEGVIVYFLLLILLKDKTLWDFLNKIKAKIFKKKEGEETFQNKIEQ